MPKYKTNLTEEQLQAASARGMLDDEPGAVARRKQVRRARQAAAERYALENASRRERARRLIRLGAEVEASGLADLLDNNPAAVFGALAELTRAAIDEGVKFPIAEYAEAGRRRQEAVEAAPRQPPPSRKSRRPPTGRIAVRFPGPPPLELRFLLRSRGYRWRLGLRAWVGSTDLKPGDLKLIREFGGEVGSGPDEG